jgi:hypothetical protein
MSILDPIFNRLMKTNKPLPAGMYPYQSSQEVETPYRLHLRLEADGSGILILNAHTIMHLNQTAAEYCYHLVKETPQDEVVRQISKRYRIDRKQVETDYQDIKTRIETLISTTDIDPVTYLGFDRETPYSSAVSAPYRLDCALTYHTATGDQKSVPENRVKNELTTEQWKTLLENAWAAGIPHIIFTGGEPTLRLDLAELIACTQKIGQVSGLLTDGLKLVENQYLNSLLENGLDHMMIVLDVDHEAAWAAVKNVLAADVHLTVHLTLDPSTTPRWQALIERLAGVGVYSLSLSASDPAYKNDLIAARHLAIEKGINLVWDLPVPYSYLHPVALENDDEEMLADGAGKAWLYVEPDGDVLPSQGTADRVLGNLLSDSWETIWHAARAV